MKKIFKVMVSVFIIATFTSIVISCNGNATKGCGNGDFDAFKTCKEDECCKSKAQCVSGSGKDTDCTSGCDCKY